jgi:pimeloyl-ACP methyl ester carboxylesterase
MRLKRFPHFKATVNGLSIHFIHERGRGPDTWPLILLHGWPESFYRFDIAGRRLTRLFPPAAQPKGRIDNGRID